MAENGKPKHPSLIAALAAAQAEIENPKMDCVNPYYNNSPYASLKAGLKVIKPMNQKHGLSLTQVPTLVQGSDDRMELVTTLTHVPTGEEKVWRWPLKAFLDKPQALASEVTYGRRYVAFPLYGLVGESDDDGNEAQGLERPPQKPARKPAKPRKPRAKKPVEDKWEAPTKSWADVPIEEIRLRVLCLHEIHRVLKVFWHLRDDPDLVDDAVKWGQVLDLFKEHYHALVDNKTGRGEPEDWNVLKNDIAEAAAKQELGTQATERI